MAPKPTWIFRIVHADNLKGILQRGGIYAPNFNPNDGLKHKAIHHLSIQAQRADKPVPCGPGGVLHDYVPFYFAPRSPMLYAIHKGRVEGHKEGQKPVIYFVSDAQSVSAAGTGFAFTDGHAIMAVSNFYDDLSQLDKVAWSVMKSKMWNDTDRAPDRKRRRQAEFLVHRFCPWPLMRGIAVFNDQMQRRVQAILDGFPQFDRPVVRVKRNWYY